MRIHLSLASLAVGMLAMACGGGTVSEGTPSTPEATDGTPGTPAAPDAPAGSVDADAETESGCTVTKSTSATSAIDAHGCAVLARDSSACAAARTAAGLSGPWLRLSCRVALAVANGVVTARSDGRPDYQSFYFPDDDVCWAEFSSGMRNPNRIATQDLSVAFPLNPGGGGEAMRTAIVGIAINGVPIYGNFAAPGDDIFNEARTFDRCAGHPQMTGMYHYHAEPTSITQDDAGFVGMLRDGNPIYGRRDADGSLPTLDADGGHTGVTPDSPSVPVYHYHVNEQTSTGARTAGEKQWFITKGRYHATPAACTGC